MIIERSTLIFEPHHGSMEKSSHKFYDYISSYKNIPHIFVISSSPDGKGKLPKENSIKDRVCTQFQVPEHPIVYNCPSIHGDFITAKLTKEPIYTTGAACDDVYIFRIKTSTIELLNLSETKPSFETILKVPKNSKNEIPH